MKYELPSTELIVIEENNYLKFGEYLNDMQCDDTANKLSLDDLEYVKKLQQENKQLKMINKEYERLNKEKNRGFKITNVQEYNIDKLLSYKKYKDNWNKLKDYIRETKLKEFEKSYGKRFGKTFTQAEVIVCNMILDKMQKLEQGSDSNVKD